MNQMIILLCTFLLTHFSFMCAGATKVDFNTNPLVTIIAYINDDTAFIEQFMADITRQTIFNQCELVIINDNSPGNEEQRITNYLERYSNIKYIKLTQNIGKFPAWNKAIKESTAPFITSAYIENRLSVGAIEEQAKALIENPNVEIVYNDMWYTYVPNKLFEEDSTKVLYEIPIEHIFANSVGNHAMWRRTLHIRAGTFNERYLSAADWAFWLKAYERGAVFMRIMGAPGTEYLNSKGPVKRGQESSARESQEIKSHHAYLLADSTKRIIARGNKAGKFLQ